MTDSQEVPVEGEAAQSREVVEPAPKRQRPATLVFTQTTLLLEAFVALFAVLTLWGLARAGHVDVPPAALWGIGFGFVALLGWAAGQQAKPRGRVIGWVLQAPMILAGLILPAIAVIGLVFLAIWITGVRLGAKIDRERAERVAAERAAASEEPAASEGEGKAA
jgi:hypothetical protein